MRELFESIVHWFEERETDMEPIGIHVLRWCAILSILGLTAMTTCGLLNDSWHRELIKRGLMQHNRTTGAVEWIEKKESK